MLRRVMGSGIVVAIIGVSGGLTATAAMPRAGTLGWRVDTVITRPKLATLLTVDAIGKRDAWAAGCAATAISKPGPGPRPSNWPLIEHFDGRAWHRMATPARLQGCIRFIRSSSPRNVWAIGWNETQQASFSAFALHLVGGRWTTAHRWGPKIVDGGLPIGAAVLGPSSVWVFFEHNIVEHDNGHAWLMTSVPGEIFLAGASADSRGGIWVAGEFSGMAYHMRVVGGAAHWFATSLAAAFPAGSQATGIFAPAPGDVWAVGSHQAQTVLRPAMAHYTAGTWHSVRLRGVFTLAGAASDGADGLWLWRGWDTTGTPPGIMRYAAGALTSVQMPVRARQRAGIFEIAAIPGTNSAWAVGAFLSNGALGASTAVIMKTGR